MKKSVSDILVPHGGEGGKVNLYRAETYQVPGEKVKVKVKVNVNVKFTLEQATKAQRLRNSTLSLTPALDRVGGRSHAPTALPPEKRPGTHCI